MHPAPVPEVARLMSDLRDLVNRPACIAHLMTDPLVWDTFCEAMDNVTDAPDPSGRLAALNEMRRIFDLPPCEVDADDGDEFALRSGLIALSAEVASFLNRLYENRRDSPLSRFLAGTAANNYVLELVARATGRGAPDRFIAGATAASLAERLSELRGELSSRGEEDWPLYELDDALHLLERVRQYCEGDDSLARDVDVMARFALPVLIDNIKELAAGIDAHDAEPMPGWDPGD